MFRHHPGQPAALRLTPLAAIACALALLAAALSGQAPSPEREALPEAEQLRQLQTLQPWQPDQLPRGVDAWMWEQIQTPGNEVNPDRVALGEKLYFDTRLSRDGKVSCATCHDVSQGFSDRRMVSQGIEGKLGRRNAPTVANAAFLQTQFLDGRAANLEEQAMLPIINPIEMGHASGADAVAAIADDPEYQRMFQAAYGEEPSYEGIGAAIAVFERTLLFLDAPFDRWLAGETDALDADAQAGFALFNGKARCVSCHHINGSNPVGSNNRFHNVGVAARNTDFEQLARDALKALAAEGSTPEVIDRLALETDMSELGRFLVTKNRADIGAFKTPQLRNVGLTAPYMHDGSLRTLWDVIDHYNRGGEAHAFLDGGIEPLNLSEAEISQLVAFMISLTDVRFAEDQATQLEQQRALAEEARPIRDRALAERRELLFQRRVLGDTPLEGKNNEE